MDDQNEVTCAVLWMVMQMHDKMDECCVAQIANQASISWEYAKFLASNYSLGHVVDAHVWLFQCKNQSRRAVEEVTQTTSKSDRAQTQGDKTSKDLKESMVVINEFKDWTKRVEPRIPLT
jgi:hypothetical protein